MRPLRPSFLKCFIRGRAVNAPFAPCLPWPYHNSWIYPRFNYQAVTNWVSSRVDEWECSMMSHHGHVGPLQLESLNNFLIIKVTMMMESHPNTSLQLSKYVIMVSAILINYEHNKLTLEQSNQFSEAFLRPQTRRASI